MLTAVFLQLSPFSQVPHLQPSEVESAQWVPLKLLFTPQPKWGSIHIDFARHAPRNSFLRGLLRLFVGKMTFRCIELPNRPTAIAENPDVDPLVPHTGLPPRKLDTGEIKSEESDDATRQLSESEQEYLEHCTPHLQLWGLTLGMTLDFLAHMSTYQLQQMQQSAPRSLIERVLSHTPSSWVLGPPDAGAASRKAPSVVEVFPRFSYPDVNFWIWVFGWRYRVILRGWQRSVGTEMERRAHWSGLALAAF